MFDNINDTLNFILNSHSGTAGFASLEIILKKYNNFHKSLKTIHITGTNGKGSTSKMISDILHKANYKVALFTSPHMVVANDRIRINGKNISDQDLIHYVNFFYPEIIEHKLNFFQIYVLVALKYFYDNKVDLSVIEVGIGGRLDATNVINSLISIITNINYDHTEKLGSDLKEIAFEKAGIIKSNNTTITMIQEKELLEILRKQVTLNKADLIALKPSPYKLKGDKLDFEFNNKIYTLNSKAFYQVANAEVAITAINVLNQKYGYNISEEAILDGLNDFTFIGRFEKVRSNPNIILDGAHNMAGIEALSKSSNHHQKYVVIFSALKDKDYKAMLGLLKDNFKEVVFCEFDFYRGLNEADLDELSVKRFSEFSLALDYLTNKYPGYDILVCGSLYFISEIRKTLVT